jgi:hypothetical protein
MDTSTGALPAHLRAPLPRQPDGSRAIVSRFGDKRMREVMLQSAILSQKRHIRDGRNIITTAMRRFWAEALHHICLQTTAPEHLAWLAEAIFDLEDLELGIPPSLLE